MQLPSISVIIINYNYSEYLNKSISSCINQKYNNKEIIVVDDGSTDHSIEIINQFDDVIKIYQENSGMMEAVNNGFQVSTGDIIIFLDADDYLFENALDEVVKKWENGISKLHFRLNTVNSQGQKIGCFPKSGISLSEGEVWKEILYHGYYITPPTSGNAFARATLELILPVKDATIGNSGTYFDKIPADAYLKKRVPFFGDVVAIQKPLGAYRLHAKNAGANTSPYTNVKKRRRLLILSRKDSDFINTFTKENNIKWDSRNLFLKNKILSLRILSFRFDDDHPFETDSKISLFKLIMYVFFAFKGKKRRFYNLAFNIILLMMPKYFTHTLISIKNK